MDFLFLVFSLLTLVSAGMVVCNRNAVNAAMFLLLSLVGMAGLFILLEAALLAFVLILVYAGAVVALFLFIIMLLDTKGTTKALNKMTVAASSLGGLLLLLSLYFIFARTQLPAPAVGVAIPTFKNYAEQLFTVYLLPVQVVGFLLLIAMLGVIVLSKKFKPTEETK
jgi:NADH-quinone oxidoreductase subunit J